jgi:hypothetical protein
VDRQGIHIGPQPDRGTVTGSENPHHTGLADVAMNFAVELSKLAGNELGRAMLREPKLVVCVQVLAPGGHFAVKQIDEMWDLHGDPLWRSLPDGHKGMH